MFNFFKKKPAGPQRRYVAYMTHLQKYRAVIHRLVDQSEPALLIYFFEQTASQIKQLCAAMDLTCGQLPNDITGCKVVLADGFGLQNLTASHWTQVECIEVFPLLRMQQAVSEAFAHLPEITFHIGLDEPLMAPFGVERIRGLLDKMGMDESESLEHAMISKSLERAMQQLEAKPLPQPLLRTSPSEWLRVNGLSG